MTTTIDRLKSLKKKNELSLPQKVKEFWIWVLRSWEQIPRVVWNVWYLLNKWLAEWAGYLWEWFWLDRKDNIFYQWWQDLASKQKQLWEDITRAWEWNITGQQRWIRRTAGELALTAPIPIKGANLFKWKWLLPTVWRGAVAWAEGMWAFTIAWEWRLPTAWELATWAAFWGAGGAVLEKAVLPIISKTIQKGSKYATAWTKWGIEWLSKSISRDIQRPFKKIKLEWLAPETAAKLSTKANRFNAKDIEDFQNITKTKANPLWETPWEFAVKRWMTKVWDEAVDEATSLYIKSMKQADEALNLIDWKFKVTKWNDYMWQMADELSSRLSNTLSKDAKKVNLLAKKYKIEGLSMSEINELKRLYSKNFKYSWVDAASENALRSKNLQDWVREWQFKTAKSQWLENLKEINKNTQWWKTFADNLAKKLKRSSWNNNISITDWIALSWGEPTNVALFLWKKVWEMTPVKRALIKWLSKQTKPSTIEATREGILKSNILKRNDTINNILSDRVSGSSTPLINKPKPLMLPERAASGKPIITPQTIEKAVIQESKKWLEKTKFGNMIKSKLNQKGIINKKAFINPGKMWSDVKKWINTIKNNPHSLNPHVSWDFKKLSELDSDDLFRAIWTKDWENIPKQVTLFRWIKTNKDFELFSWDFLTKNKKIAQNFAWKDWRVKSFKVNTKDLKWSDFGYEEVVYSPTTTPKPYANKKAFIKNPIDPISQTLWNMFDSLLAPFSSTAKKWLWKAGPSTIPRGWNISVPWSYGRTTQPLTGKAAEESARQASLAEIKRWLDRATLMSEKSSNILPTPKQIAPIDKIKKLGTLRGMDDTMKVIDETPITQSIEKLRSQMNNMTQEEFIAKMKALIQKEEFKRDLKSVLKNIIKLYVTSELWIRGGAREKLVDKIKDLISVPSVQGWVTPRW